MRKNVRNSPRNSAQAEVADAQIRDALSPFAVSVNDDQLRKIRDYLLLLQQWNRAMNLTTVSEPVEIVRRHFGESMFAAKLFAGKMSAAKPSTAKMLPVETVENCRLADVGTGAGLPGLALKIALPEIQVVLIESNKKKCAFLAEVVRKLEIEGVEILGARFEETRPEQIAANVVTARALGDFVRFLKWTERVLTSGARLFLWVGAEDATRIAKETSWNWEPAVHIPDSQRRYLLVGRPSAGRPENP